ncbi:unnamed protein product [Allacma fusca]|uniref:Integrase catalytic domain-containing protein n=1 Tax=Allacma fusca TaxID=39272 RepID=A0A8J2KPM5_9HEXA|nr:unnamed protein product [Allacma fusca]
MTTTSAIYAINLWILRFSTPSIIVCDNGAAFSSKEFQDLCAKKGIKLIFISPNHPSSNGICERTHANINRMIAKHVNENQRNWDTLLPEVCSKLNSTVNEVTHYSPYFLLFGRHPNLRVDGILPVVKDGPVNQFEFYKNLINARWRANENTCRTYNPFGEVLMPELVKSTSLMTTGVHMAQLEKFKATPTVPQPLKSDLEVLKKIDKPIKKQYTVAKPPSLLAINPQEIVRNYKIKCFRCSGPHPVKNCTKKRNIKFPDPTPPAPMYEDWM